MDNYLLDLAKREAAMLLPPLSADHEAALQPSTRAALKDAREAGASYQAAKRKGDRISMLRAEGLALATKAVLVSALKSESQRQPSPTIATRRGDGKHIEYAGLQALRKAGLQHSTRLALAHAKDAVTKHEFLKQAGSPAELARARVDTLVAKADLERASAHEKALGAMRGALAKPIRLF